MLSAATNNTAQPTTDPTSEPTGGPGFHYIAAGDKDNSNWASYSDKAVYLCTEDSSSQSPIPSEIFDYDIAVGCCEIDGSGGARPDCNAHPKTYDEAVALCQQHGYRLCTLQEMLYDELTKGLGCSYDNAYHWVSDTCNGTR